jgi:hypothetical protein
MGRDPNSPKKYNDLVTILRDDTQVERFLDKTTDPNPKPRKFSNGKGNGNPNEAFDSRLRQREDANVGKMMSELRERGIR